MEEEKMLNVAYADDKPSSVYTLFLERVFNKKVNIIHSRKRDDQRIDLIVFTGGEDVSPSFYDEESGKYTSSNIARDKYEINTFERLYHNIPKLGICRGSQLLTVLNRGKLIQHVENHASGPHTITLHSGNLAGKTIELPSTHHQMMYPYNLPKEQYELIGHSTYFRSSVYLNGDNKNIKIPSDFLEPEIVFYPGTQSLAIQAHPEYINHETIDFKIIKQIILNKLLKNT